MFHWVDAWCNFVSECEISCWWKSLVTVPNMICRKFCVHAWCLFPYEHESCFCKVLFRWVLERNVFALFVVVWCLVAWLYASFCWWASNPYLCFVFAGMKRYTASASCAFQKKSWVLDCVVWFIIDAWLCCVICCNVFFVCDVVVLSWVQVLSVKLVSSCNDRRTKLKNRSNANPF